MDLGHQRIKLEAQEGKSLIFSNPNLDIGHAN